MTNINRYSHLLKKPVPSAARGIGAPVDPPPFTGPPLPEGFDCFSGVGWERKRMYMIEAAKITAAWQLGVVGGAAEGTALLAALLGKSVDLGIDWGFRAGMSDAEKLAHLVPMYDDTEYRLQCERDTLQFRINTERLGPEERALKQHRADLLSEAIKNRRRANQVSQRNEREDEQEQRRLDAIKKFFGSGDEAQAGQAMQLLYLNEREIAAAGVAYHNAPTSDDKEKARDRKTQADSYREQAKHGVLSKASDLQDQFEGLQGDVEIIRAAVGQLDGHVSVLVALQFPDLIDELNIAPEFRRELDKRIADAKAQEALTKAVDRIKEVQQAGQALAMLVSFFDPEAGQWVGGIVNAGTSVALAATVPTPETILAAVGSVSNLVGMVMNKGKLSPEQQRHDQLIRGLAAINEGILTLRKEIHQLHVDLLSGFQDVHRHLDNVERRLGRVQESLDEVLLRSALLDLKLETLVDDLKGSQLEDRQYSAILARANRVFHRTVVNAEVRRILDRESLRSQQVTDGTRAMKIVEGLLRHATVISADGQNTGEDLQLAADELVFFERLWKTETARHSEGSLLTLLRSLANGQPTGIEAEGIAPLSLDVRVHSRYEWERSVDAIMQLLDRLKDVPVSLTPSQVEDLIASGVEVEILVAILAHPATLDTAMRAYEIAWNELLLEWDEEKEASIDSFRRSVISPELRSLATFERVGLDTLPIGGDPSFAGKTTPVHDAHEFKVTLPPPGEATTVPGLVPNIVELFALDPALLGTGIELPSTAMTPEFTSLICEHDRSAPDQIALAMPAWTFVINDRLASVYALDRTKENARALSRPIVSLETAMFREVRSAQTAQHNPYQTGREGRFGPANTMIEFAAGTITVATDYYSKPTFLISLREVDPQNDEDRRLSPDLQRRLRGLPGAELARLSVTLSEPVKEISVQRQMSFRYEPMQNGIVALPLPDSVVLQSKPYYSELNEAWRRLIAPELRQITDQARLKIAELKKDPRFAGSHGALRVWGERKTAAAGAKTTSCQVWIAMAEAESPLKEAAHQSFVAQLKIESDLLFDEVKYNPGYEFSIRYVCDSGHDDSVRKRLTATFDSQQAIRTAHVAARWFDQTTPLNRAARKLESARQALTAIVAYSLPDEVGAPEARVVRAAIQALLSLAERQRQLMISARAGGNVNGVRERMISEEAELYAKLRATIDAWVSAYTGMVETKAFGHASFRKKMKWLREQG